MCLYKFIAQGTEEFLLPSHLNQGTLNVQYASMQCCSQVTKPQVRVNKEESESSHH